jgi:hypothetical protein
VSASVGELLAIFFVSPGSRSKNASRTAIERPPKLRNGAVTVCSVTPAVEPSASEIFASCRSVNDPSGISRTP